MDDILRVVDAALERRGISARAASIRAQGAPELIRDMRRGHVPSVARLRALCEVLGLEFYVGPPRWRRREDGGALPDIPLRALERSARDLAQLTVDAGGSPISDDLWAVLVDQRRASALPGTDKDPPPTEDRPLDIVQLIVRGDAESPGAPADGRPEQDWTSRRWLQERGVDAAHCAVVRMRDESMEPTLPKGCALLVDSASMDWAARRIMAVRLGDDMVFRRAATSSDGQRLMACDHPDWPDEPLPADARIAGRVRWLGRWLE